MFRYIGIDPGLDRSAVIVTDQYEPVRWGYMANKELRDQLINANIVSGMPAKVIIEKPICRKYAGADVSDTAIWTGIFIASWPEPWEVELLSRSKVSMNTPHVRKANDSTIKKDIIKRFPEFAAKFDAFSLKVDDKIKLDIFQAYALVVVYLDTKGGIKWRD